MAAHHPHVARRIEGAFLLLVGKVVLLVDDDEAEIGKGQEQGRARSDDDLQPAGRDPAPDPLAGARRHLRMPFRRPGAEAQAEAFEEIGGERNLRQQDEHLPARLHRRRHRLEIDFRLARTGDAVEERHRIAAGSHRLAQMVGRRGLLGGEFRCAIVRIGRQRHRPRRHQHGFQRAGIDQPLHHAGTDAGPGRQTAFRPGRVGDHFPPRPFP